MKLTKTKYGLRFIQILLITSISFYLFSCSSDVEREFTNEVEIILEEVLSIGDGDPDDPNYLFSSIASVVTDDENRIWIAEHFGNHLKVFDDEGTFQKQIGREGDGPGEFRMILSMTDDRSGNILITDQSTGSVSIFNTGGEYIDDFSLPNPQVRQINQLGENLFLAVFSDPETNRVLHTFNDAFDRIDSFAHRDEIIHTDERFEEVITVFLPGRFLVVDESTVYFTPVFYHGELFQYTRENNGWTQSAILDGFTQKPAFESTNPETEGAYVLDLGSDTLAAIIHNESRGLFLTHDDTIIHFTSTRQSDGIRVFGAELYSLEGELLAYNQLKDQVDGDFYVHHIDQHGYVYISEQFEETVLRKYRLNFR
jgi:hypothetical protein